MFSLIFPTRRLRLSLKVPVELGESALHNKGIICKNTLNFNKSYFF